MTFKKLSVATGLVLSACVTVAPATEPDSRRAKGMETLEKITGATGNTVVNSLSDISPELGEWIVDSPTVMCFPGLASRFAHASWQPSRPSPRWGTRNRNSRCT